MTTKLPNGQDANRPPRVLLADDYPPLLVSWQRFLQRSCDIVGVVSSGRELVETALVLKPDVVVVDLGMPGMNGLEACRDIKEAIPATQVILVTAFDDVTTREAARRAGASAFVAKLAGPEELEQAVQQAFAAGLIVSAGEGTARSGM
jgi:DNA-binding NarL/FixJ family response regulator